MPHNWWLWLLLNLPHNWWWLLNDATWTVASYWRRHIEGAMICWWGTYWRGHVVQNIEWTGPDQTGLYRPSARWAGPDWILNIFLSNGCVLRLQKKHQIMPDWMCMWNVRVHVIGMCPSYECCVHVNPIFSLPELIRLFVFIFVQRATSLCRSLIFVCFHQNGEIVHHSITPQSFMAKHNAWLWLWWCKGLWWCNHSTRWQKAEGTICPQMDQTGVSAYKARG